MTKLLEQLIANMTDSEKLALAAMIEGIKGESQELSLREDHESPDTGVFRYPTGWLSVGTLNADITRNGRLYPKGLLVVSGKSKAGNSMYLAVSNSGNIRIGLKDVLLAGQTETSVTPKTPKTAKPSPSDNVVQLANGNVMTYKVDRNWTWIYFSEVVLSNSTLGQKLANSGAKWSGRRSRQGYFGCQSAYRFMTIISLADIVSIIG